MQTQSSPFMILIRDAARYCPQYEGRGDVLLAGGRVVAEGRGLGLPSGVAGEIIEAKGLKLIPGLIDGHVHIAGAGGEGGPATRTPEVALRDIISGGVTSLVGCLGTDGFTRSVESLIMKAKGLKQDGLSCWIYTGSYQVPPPTIFGDVARDLCFVEEVVGVGEVAVADHRSSSPTLKELIKLAKHTRVGGMLSGKAGVVHLHMGDEPDPFRPLRRAVRRGGLSYAHFFPTHVTRNAHIFEDAKQYALQGPVDITTGSYPFFQDEEVKPSRALAELLQAGVPLEHISFSSDAGGSLPSFDAKGRLIKIKMGQNSSLLEEVRDAVQQEKIPLEQAIRVLTANPAAILKLPRKGAVQPGMDADVVLLDDDFQVRYLIAGGRLMIREGEIIHAGALG